MAPDSGAIQIICITQVCVCGGSIKTYLLRSNDLNRDRVIRSGRIRGPLTLSTLHGLVFVGPGIDVVNSGLVQWWVVRHWLSGQVNVGAEMFNGSEIIRKNIRVKNYSSCLSIFLTDCSGILSVPGIANHEWVHQQPFKNRKNRYSFIFRHFACSLFPELLNKKVN